MRKILIITIVSILTGAFAQSDSIVVLRDNESAGILFPMVSDGYLYISTDQLVTIGGGPRYFANEKFKESIRMWGTRVVFSPENPFAVIDGTPYNLGLPVRLSKNGLMVPFTGFFEAFALAAHNKIIFHTDTVKLSSIEQNFSEIPETTETESVSQTPTKRENKNSTRNEGKKGLIVIDPGHGGKDPGAIGPSGIREKDITLVIAKDLKNELENRGYKIILTRDSDIFISLADRSKLANKLKADLFVSIHCNASKKKEPHGTQGFYLSPAKTDEARAAAALENKSLLIENDPIIDNLSELQYIMADMVQSTYQRESSILSYIIEQNISKEANLEARGPQGAGFYVLYGNYMPAVLIETAFISNKKEEKFLTLPNNQKKIANAIADGIDQFWGNIKK